jgi:hypothetical protein
MLTWLDGRNGSSFGSIAWNGSALTFERRAKIPFSAPSGPVQAATFVPSKT